VILSMLFVFLLGFASASITLNNYTLKKTYSPYEIISGQINLTISNEKLDAVLSSGWGQTISLRDFLDNNSASYSCSTFDCSDDYNFSRGEESKKFLIDAAKKNYFGFVLFGESLTINRISFDVASDFGMENKVPLKMEFFGIKRWEFDEESDDFTRSISYGCYDESKGMPGPFIRSLYCEKINLPKAKKLEMGVRVAGTDDKPLKMTVYDSFKSPGPSCEFLPSDGEGSCIVEYDFAPGEYFVCVSPADSDNAYSYNYQLFSESSGINCGWPSLPSTENSTRDYSIFAKTAKYAPAKNVTIDENEVEGLVSAANTFLYSKYNYNCSEGCVLPVVVEGVSQNLSISNITIDYYSQGDYSSKKVYDISVIPPTVDFSGVLQLSKTNFDVGEKGTKDFELYLNGNKFFEEEITVLPAPIIKNVYPINPPAGISFILYADVESETPIKNYFWDFGDNTTQQTTNASVVHTYFELGSYTLTLNVTDANGFTTSKSFLIIAGSPEDVVNETLDEKKQALENALEDINKFPAWLQDILKELANISFYQYELNRLEKEIENAFTDEDFLNIAIELQNLDVPSAVFVSEQKIFPLFTDLSEIDPEPIAIIAGGVSNDSELEDYKNPILQWQRENIKASIESKKISIARSNNEVALLVYSVNVSSNSEYESYFVIKKKREDLYFKESSDARKVGDYTILILDKYGSRNFDFYFKGSEEAVFYVSPKLSLLPTQPRIGPCNFNKICEKDKGENYKNCRSDCKPWGWMIFYLFLAILFGLVVYTIFQMWYKTRYEKFLFKDRRYLFNLVNFINNASARGMSDKQIKSELKKYKWSGEQIVYAMKKSRGQRTGMYELIPIEKIFAWFRRRKVENAIQKQSQQQSQQYPPTINFRTT